MDIHLSIYLPIDIYFKELTHWIIVGAGESEIHMAGQWAGYSGYELMLQSWVWILNSGQQLKNLGKIPTLHSFFSFFPVEV